MRTDYENRYLDAVRSMVEGGMEVRLLNGRTLRERTGSGSDIAMTPEFSEQVRSLCCASLALDEHSADMLHERLSEDSSAVSHKVKTRV